MEQVMTKLDMREFKTEETTVTTQNPITPPKHRPQRRPLLRFRSLCAAIRQ